MTSSFARLRAEALHGQAQAASDGGDDEAALALYHQALKVQPERPQTLYNIGLIHKYRRAWPESLAYNQRAFALRPDDEAIRWNLGIAATAVGDWATAREAWRGCGYDVGEGEGPIEVDFGSSCVRLNPDGAPEVVWVSRIDPVRARIDNVPYAESGYFFGDIVLHDGAPTGSKVSGEQEYPIFNAFECVARSGFGTAVVTVQAPSEPDADALLAAIREGGLYGEDWASSIQFLCKQCSEGVTHIDHDENLTVWNPDRTLGIAVIDDAAIDNILDAWADGPGRRLVAIEVFR